MVQLRCWGLVIFSFERVRSTIVTGFPVKRIVVLQKDEVFSTIIIHNTMKILFSLLFTLSSISAINAQDITINVSGTTVDIQNQVHYITLVAGDNWYSAGTYHIHNESQVDKTWIITREIIADPVDWKLQIGYGELGEIGNCYPPSDDLLFATMSQTIPAGGAAELYANIDNFLYETGGCATYRFHVSEDGINYLTHFDIDVCMVLGLEDQSPLVDVQLFPNPATSEIKLQGDLEAISTISILNAQGETIEVVTSGFDQTIDVSNYATGLYYVQIEMITGEAKMTKITVAH